MAENNSSAPLKTAEGSYPALPKPAYPARFNGHGGEQSSNEGYSAEQMRAYAAQAVAAQAAPAAVVNWEEAARAMSVEIARNCNSVPQLVFPFLYLGLKKLLATPALPATEDSSAGDLAEGPAGSGGWKVHAESLEKECAYWKTLADTMRAHQRNDVWYWQGDGNDNPKSMVNSLAVVIRADDLRDLMAKPQAEVQAEPVAVREDEKWRERWYGSPPMKGWSIMHGREQIAYLGPDASSDDVRALVDALNAAPQAQPADALDAETPYQRGYRHGYNQRDAEVQGALL